MHGEVGGDVYSRYCWGNLRGKNHLEYLDVNGRIILKKISRSVTGIWTGLMWLRIWKGGGLL
jgi:hypothetical protein